MAKYTKEYENDIEKHVVIFRDKVFDFSMIPAASGIGLENDKESFEYQICNEFSDLTVEELEEIGVGDLWCEQEEAEIFEILNKLGEIE